MGIVLFLLFVGLPLWLASLLAKGAARSNEWKGFLALLMLALGGFTAWLGYEFGIVGSEEIAGNQIVTTTYPVVGILDIVVGIGIGLWGLAVLGSRRESSSQPVRAANAAGGISRVGRGSSGGEVANQMTADSLEHAAHAMDHANNVVSLMAKDFKPEEIGIVWEEWWRVFLADYSSEMGEWFLQVASSKHTGHAELEKLWDNVFDNLMAGTLEVVVNSRIKEVQESLAGLAEAPHLSSGQELALGQWASKLCDNLKLTATKYNEACRTASRRTAFEMLKGLS